MRKYLLFALLLCIQLSAHGQTTYDYRYWFDMDEGNQHTGTSSTGSWNIEADLSGLDCSLHAIHIQVKDTSGVWSAPKTRYFVKMPDRTLAGGNYWFDNDFLSRQPLATVNGKFDVDVSSMSETLHYIHFQANDAAGYVSSPFTSLFMKLPVEKSLSYRYWLDNDQTTMKSGKLTGESMMFDVSDLTDGFHVITLQVDGNGGSSIPANRMFIKIPQTEGVSELTCMCTIDGKVYKQEKVASSGGVVDWSLDVSPLSQGLHRIQVQVFTPSGAATDIYDSFFFRTTMDGELQNMNLVYSIDGGDHKSIKGSYNNGMFHFDMDVASIEDGLHNMTYMLASETGTSTKVNSAFFMKTPVGGPGIISYKYWLNDYEDETRYVKLEERKNPYDLITLLPVDTCPIRSSCFHFEIQDDGTPMVYAKNDIHFQFYDVSNRVAEAHKQYVDYNVGEKIEEIKLLNSGVREYMQKPFENQIYWFKVNAERGDSLAFKTDVAATIQVFAPSCEEVFKSQGSSSVVYGGCHARENGTYYVALHDVTGTRGSTIAIDYQHISKFALLDYQQRSWGVLPGTQVMDLFGNGFDNLESVVLKSNETEIYADTVLVKDKSNCHVLFNLTGEETYAAYNLILNFNDSVSKETLTEANAVTMEMPDFGDVKVEITDPRRVASPYPVSIKVTNTSNLTYSNIPFCFAHDNVEQIESMTFMNFYIDVDKKLVDNGLKTELIVDNFKGTGKKARMFTSFIPVLLPGESQTFVLGFKAGNHVDYNVYGWIGTPWNLYTTETMYAIQKLANEVFGEGDNSSSGGSGSSSGSSSSGSGSGGSGSSSIGSGSGSGSGVIAAFLLPGAYGGNGTPTGNGTGNVMGSCMPDPCDIVGAISNDINECACATVFNNAGVLGNIYRGLINRQRAAYREQMGDFYDGESFEPLHLADPSDFLWNMGEHCLPGKLGDVVGAFNKQREMLGSDPCPDPNPHQANQWNPGDPNDILGYEAPSGSKYMRNDIEDVSFVIRCENDPKIANAAAHKVVITDTIDGRYYDLETFTPTEVNIGGRILKLDGTETNFVKTIDLRTSIDAIAQVQLEYNKNTGIACWTFTALDPMTMEPTWDIMQGVLPVNSNGDGEGSVSYDIKQKTGLSEGTAITSRASIVFDFEGAIQTPPWTNIIDATAPTSKAIAVEQTNDSTAVLSIEATDELSGMWRYDVYVQYGSGAWFLAAENVPADTTATVKIYEGIDHGFYVVATDSAGNVEQKEPMRELSYNLTSVVKGDVNGDGRISIVDITMVTNAVLKKEDENFNAEAADMNLDGRVSIVDATMITNIILKK